LSFCPTLCRGTSQARVVLSLSPFFSSLFLRDSPRAAGKERAFSLFAIYCAIGFAPIRFFRCTGGLLLFRSVSTKGALERFPVFPFCVDAFSYNSSFPIPFSFRSFPWHRVLTGTSDIFTFPPPFQFVMRSLLVHPIIRNRHGFGRLKPCSADPEVNDVSKGLGDILYPFC